MKFAVAMPLLSLGAMSAGATGEAPSQLSVKPMMGDWGIEAQYIAPSVIPGNDFYTYVNDGWLKQAQLPQGMASMNSFTEVYLRSENQIKAIVDDLLANPAETEPHRRQIADLYRSFMDEAHIEELGLSPIKAELDDILKLDNRADIARRMANPLDNTVMGLGVDLDEKNPNRYVLYLTQSGLGMPGREYYLNDSAPFPEMRKAYTAYIEGTLKRAQLPNPADSAKAILQFEIELATAQWTPEQTRDRLKSYHPMSIGDLNAYAPGFEWTAFMQANKVAGQKQLIVATDTAIKGTAELFAKTPVEVLRNYLAFHFIDNQAQYLPKAYADANFDFFGRTLNGIKEQRPRNLRALQFVSNNLGEVLGRLYVERYFPPANKAMMANYIHYISESLRQHIEQSKWMDEPTRMEALAKLDAFAAKVGYPDQWRDYSSIVIKKDDLIGNNVRIQDWNMRDALSKLGQPRRNWEWEMSPQVINAYYSPPRNEIVFPAAILQPPFFDPQADAAVNFGAIGAIIGHEMGHGFDDQGSRSDGKGVLRDWWSKDAREHFDNETGKLVQQYNAYEPLPGTRINGQLTLGENIGDLGGVTIAYTAYRHFLDQTSKGQAPVIDGVTGDQRFFLAWAQVWRGIQTDDSLRNQLLTNPHSPGQYRVNGVLRNIDAWYRAFSVTPENQLYLAPEKRVVIW
jgi:endothelin-converting enzyme/putative endopeptidase